MFSSAAGRACALGWSFLCAATTAVAQTASLTGFVAADSNGAARLTNAEVIIAAQQITARTNWLGEFVIGPIAPGRYLVSVRHVGYVSTADSVTIGDDTQHNFVLAKPPVTLDSVVATATAPRKWISPGLNAFEERRRTGAGGHFLDADLLRRSENRSLVDVLAGYTPGLSFVRLGGNAAYGYSTRNQKGAACAMCVSRSSKTGYGTLPGVCYATVYLDGVLIYDISTTGGAPPNLNDYRVNDLGAAEYYGGEASVPLPYKSSGCGTLLLWTRER
ncbi:MAG: carboxypeptidase-like regulatory domain-containing protein [bacterium]